jgi:hypothetical protein
MVLGRQLNCALVMTMLIAAGGCGHSSATDQRLAAVEHVPLPPASQPPDPCSLLTVPEVNGAFEVTVRMPTASEPATGGREWRSCSWFAAHGLLSLSIVTEPSHRAMCMATGSAAGLGVAAVEKGCGPLGLPSFVRPPRYQRLRGVGDAADIDVTYPSADLYVMAGSSRFELRVTDMTPPGDIVEVLKSLAGKVTSRITSTN